MGGIIMNSGIKPTLSEILVAVNYLMTQAKGYSLTAEAVSSLIYNVIHNNDTTMTNFNDYVEAALDEWDIECNRNYLDLLIKN